MTKLLPLLFIFLLPAIQAAAQIPSDSIPVKDTVSVHVLTQDTTVQAAPVKRKKLPALNDSAVQHHPDLLAAHSSVFHTDSLRFSNTRPPVTEPATGWMDLLKSNPFFNFSGKPVRVKEEVYVPGSFDGLFYLLVGLLFFFAIVKLVFGKYLGNLLTLFFRVSMRQQQIREQVLQSPFPSLLLNLLFVLSGGLYGSFLLRYYHYANPDQFWTFFWYGAGFLFILYGMKFILLKITGWIFNIQRPVETYLFVVFLTNKIIGIFLLPFLVILSFSGDLASEICVTLSLIMIGIFYIYRIITSYETLRKEIKISGLHFFLYLCAFEIAPLLLIYKVLVTYFGKAF